ncbi:DNA topology modulation protein [Bacillus horti]|uniref:Adenylate kinase family enzyme n=1 Tax=Caldalkalibacillus horti TaxID=77523 RepID=A0ABT9W2F7_9BACI|nr:DNA topology modulation protein [Bacillus horti]MDQ0167439.1 adenylate kinase family enzyme [Bacillus horti]
MKKVMLIGSGGSGKSTLSRRLGEVTTLPVYHLDSLFWKPDWVPTEDIEWDEIQAELSQLDEWIIDGNYGRTMDIRMEAADTIIFFDFPRWLTIYRVIKRRVKYHGKTRPDMTVGCPEKLDLEFLKWIWNFRRDKRPAILDKLEKYSSEKNVIIFQRPAEVTAFLKQLKLKSK